MQDDLEVLSALRERPNGAAGFLPTRIWEAASLSALFCSSAEVQGVHGDSFPLKTFQVLSPGTTCRQWFGWDGKQGKERY